MAYGQACVPPKRVKADGFRPGGGGSRLENGQLLKEMTSFTDRRRRRPAGPSEHALGTLSAQDLAGRSTLLPYA